MKCGLSFIFIVGGGVILIFVGVLLVYMCMFGDYGEIGVFYLFSMMMEEEGLYFVQCYQEDLVMLVLDSYYFKGSVGIVGLLLKFREMFDILFYKSIGVM